MLILGTDVWADGAEEAALRFVESAGIPTITNGMGRGVVPGGHPLLVTKARGQALGGSDLVVVVGTPLDFRLGLRRLRRQGRRDAGPGRARRRLPRPGLRARRAGRLGLRRPHLGLRRAASARSSRSCAGPTGRRGSTTSRTTVKTAAERDAELLGAEADPIHPARIYGELVPRLADDAVVIGDGGDFVSFAGKFVEPKRPGGWLDPGPYGCLGAGLGAAIAARLARPSAQVVLLLGDGAAGFSLMDVDTLVRHNLPVVMVMGNNSAWGLEKGPMQMLYGYDVVADLAPRTPYDEVVKALGGAGETVTDPRQIGAGAGPRVRRERALPRQRDHRRRRGVPAHHVRHLSPRPCSSAGPTTWDYATVGEVTVAAYAEFTTGPQDAYIAHLRDAATRDREAELWVATPDDRDDLVLGTVTICPDGSPWRELGGRGRGRVPDAGRGTVRPRAAASARRWSSCASTGSATTGARAVVLSHAGRDDGRAPRSTSGSASCALPSSTGSRTPAST